MYTPRSFKEERLDVLHRLICENGFGLFISQTESGLMATHLPFQVDPDRGKNGTLISHLARANPHWKTISNRGEVMVVFQGPHCYISPAWYQEQETVPTWNYAAVHVYGAVEFFEDPERLRPLLENLVSQYESKREKAWPISKAATVMDSHLKAVVGIEIQIERIEGKMKFNQNLSIEDQAGVVEALRDSSDSMEASVADIMAKNLKAKKA